MLTRFPRIVGAAIVSFLLLAWLYRGESTSFHRSNSHHSLNDPFAEPVSHPSSLYAPPASQPEDIHYADQPDSTTALPDRPDVIVKPGHPVINRKKSPFGYVFYATSDEYACSALVSVNRLQQFHTPHRLFAFLTKAVSPEYKAEMEKLNVEVTIMKPPAHPHAKPLTEGQPTNTRLENNLLKLMAFRIQQLQPDLARVIVLDADTFIYKTLDSLFLLPDADVAAPRAYWKGRGVLSSRLLLISLSDRLWKSVEAAIKELGINKYDSDLINDLFGDSAMVLPGQYMVPDSHWVDWSMPAWYRPEGDVHKNGMVESYSEAKLEELWRIINISVGGDDEELKKSSAKQESNVEVKRVEKRAAFSEEDLGEILTLEQIRKEREEGEKLANDPPVDKEEAKSKSEEPVQKPEESEKKPEEPEKKPEEPEKLPVESALNTVQAQEEKVEKPEASKTSLPIPGLHKPSPPPELVQTPLPPAPYDAETHPNRGSLFQLQDRVAVLHFGVIAKPWEKHIQGLQDMKKEFHPTIYEQFRHWRENAQKFCPKVNRQKKDAPEGEMEIYHLVNNV